MTPAHILYGTKEELQKLEDGLDFIKNPKKYLGFNDKNCKNASTDEIDIKSKERNDDKIKISNMDLNINKDNNNSQNVSENKNM